MFQIKFKFFAMWQIPFFNGIASKELLPPTGFTGDNDTGCSDDIGEMSVSLTVVVHNG